MNSPARFITAVILLSCAVSTQRVQAQFVPPDKALYDTVMRLDSLFFGAYNTCSIHLKEYGDFYADNLEFYHDQGGLNTSKQEVIEATRKNICGKVTRKLVPGSAEVYPIANFGAIEIGYHTFHNNTQPPEAKPHPGRFVVIWNRTKDGWKITRVISLH